jgi:PAS domain S-box-containing protein
MSEQPHELVARLPNRSTVEHWRIASLNDPEARDTISQSLLDELPALRLKADRAIGLLAAIVDSSDDAIVSKTLDGVITSWNASAERLFGYTASEAVGQHISLIIPVNRRDEETVIIERIKRGERIEHFDTVRVRKDKTLLDIALTISPVRDASGKIVGASKIARDIAQRKQIERELHESEGRYRVLADALDTQVQFRTQELEKRNSELSTLSGRLMESQDAERRRIARELHDSAGQTLAALSMKPCSDQRRRKARPCSTRQRPAGRQRVDPAFDTRNTHNVLPSAPTDAGRIRH